MQNKQLSMIYTSLLCNLIKLVDTKNNTSLVKYDLAGRKVAEVSPKNVVGTDINSMERTEYTYDLMSRIKTKAVVFKKWNMNNITYNWTKDLTRVVIAAYEYDILGNITKKLDAMGFAAGTGITDDEKIYTGYGTTNTYTLSGQLETTKDAESKNNNLPYFVKYEYNGLGQKVKETYSDETEISYTYNGTGNLLSSYVNGKQKGSAKYDLLGRVTETKDGMGNITITKWNAFDKVAYVKTPDDYNTKSDPHPSKTTAFQYDESGNLMYSIDSLEKINEYTYDFLNRQTSNTTRNEASSERITVSYGYDANGNKTYETDGNGNTINYTYNELNQLKSASINVSGKNKTTTYTYDANGNKISETDYQGNTTQYVYDGINRLVETIDATGTVIGQMEYNNANAQIRVYDALHNVTEYGYDKNLRQTYIEDGEGHITRQSYDNRGNVATKTDGRYNITTYRYDAENRLKSVINPLGETTTYTYDNNGNMLTQTDGNGNVTTYVYNAMNKLRKKIDPNGINNASKTESYKYRADGLLKSKVDRNRKKTTYTYDIFGRLLCENADGEIKSYTYDNNGNLLTMTDNTGTTTRTYDEQNRVTTKTVPVIGQTIYQYDIPSNISGYIVEKTTDPKGNISEKTYDKVGRLYSVKTGDKITKYDYYTNGNRKSIIYPEGTKETYTYYKDNKVHILKNIKSDGTVLQSYTYTYDAAENQTSKTTSDGTTIYEYDSLNRLEKVTEPNGKITSYSFDKAGNRKTEIVIVGENLTGTSYIYNEQNRLISSETKLSDKKTEKTIYEYDNNGNLKSKTKSIMTITDANTPTDIQNMPSFELEIIRSTDKGSGSQDLTLYSYDNFNRLIMLKEGSTTSTYNYNAQDYRVEKTVGNNTTLYLYEADKVILETDSTGNQLAKNVYGTTLLYRLVEENGTSPEEEYYYMYNAHGDVTALISPNGEVKGTYDYDAFGNIISQTGDVNNNITYAGYQYDKETDLYYVNARYYDSKIARFITEDSYRGNANDPLSLNVYTYCHNEPIMYTDPTGHWEKGDSELSDVAQIKIIELTDAYFKATTEEERERIQAAANSIREEDKKNANKSTLITMNKRFYQAVDIEYNISDYEYIEKDQWERIRKLKVLENYNKEVPGKHSNNTLEKIGMFIGANGFKSLDQLRKNGVGWANWDNELYDNINKRLKYSNNVIPVSSILDYEIISEEVKRLQGKYRTTHTTTEAMPWNKPIYETLEPLYNEYSYYVEDEHRLLNIFFNSLEPGLIAGLQASLLMDIGSNAIGSGVYSDLAKQATNIPNSTEVVLGKYCQDGISYVKIARQRGATYFELKNWDNIVDVVGKNNMWKINEKFLLQQLEQGKSFILSHSPYNATGYYVKEVKFLLDKGFKFIKDGQIWRAIK
ncbi:RHS repeat protein [Sedimentibacter sp. zth1]|uniref:RHS repeat protein n=1 Tax=Sedimentibacter sp. zth1 TaxID=2816908 RepID=UPI001A928E1E|nr:RHS repeat protein [Sedimentibacter sp. zth1]QSX04823.1 RHS repeat protein [Sedimentibacter sp. zth1]